MSQDINELRAQMEASFEQARARVAERIGHAGQDTESPSRIRVQEQLRASKAHAQRLLNGTSSSHETAVTSFSLADAHLLEELLSHVRHSVVRVCFYNLKLFCPSLVDEYDDHVREQVLLNLDQLPRVREELDGFFEVKLSTGDTLAVTFPQGRQQALDELKDLEKLARTFGDNPDDVERRRTFAEAAPRCIDALMEGLNGLQAELDSRKVAVGEEVERAVGLMRAECQEAGLEVALNLSKCPRVFAAEGPLLNAFVELIRNAARHANATLLDINVQPVGEGGRWVEVILEDDGDGMTEEEAQRSLLRGVSRTVGGGDGLPMVASVVEGEHFGCFELTGTTGRGCRAIVRLPVKLDRHMTNREESST